MCVSTGQSLDFSPHLQCMLNHETHLMCPACVPNRQYILTCILTNYLTFPGCSGTLTDSRYPPNWDWQHCSIICQSSTQIIVTNHSCNVRLSVSCFQINKSNHSVSEGSTFRLPRTRIYYSLTNNEIQMVMCLTSECKRHWKEVIHGGLDPDY